MSQAVAKNLTAYIKHDFSYISVLQDLSPDTHITIEMIEELGVNKFEAIAMLDKAGIANIENSILTAEQATHLFTHHAKLAEVNTPIIKYFKAFAFNLIHDFGDGVYAGGFTLEQLNNNLPTDVKPFKRGQRTLTTSQTSYVLNLALEKLDNPDNLLQEMYIQFEFAKNVMRSVPMFGRSSSKPTGKLDEIVSKLPSAQSFQQFLSNIQSPTKTGFETRKHVSDSVFYGSDYYTVEARKGRSGNISTFIKTRFYGTLNSTNLSQLQTEQLFTDIFPQTEVSWNPDSVAQNAETSNSKVVQDLLQHEASYVSGPSGTTSLDLGLMETLCNFDSVSEKQIYLQSVLAYVVGSGLHSTHEVLGPAAHCLDLIPGYNTCITNDNLDSLSPNFHCFYEIASQNDPQFADRRDLCWSQSMKFYDNLYRPRLNPTSAADLFVNIIAYYDPKDGDARYSQQRLLTLLNSGLTSLNDS